MTDCTGWLARKKGKKWEKHGRNLRPKNMGRWELMIRWNIIWCFVTFLVALNLQDSHRRRSLSGSQSSSGVAKEGGDNYGIDLLFQPDNAPPRTPPTSGTQDGERRGRVKRRKRSFYRIKVIIPTKISEMLYTSRIKSKLIFCWLRAYLIFDIISTFYYGGWGMPPRKI